MIILTVDEIILMHRKLIDKTGGLDGIRDMGMLESAVMNCNLTFGEEELYPSVLEKAARLAFSLCRNHPFVDGNKRTAVLAMLVELKINKINVAFTKSELISIGMGLADGSIDYKSLVDNIKKHQD